MNEIWKHDFGYLFPRFGVKKNWNTLQIFVLHLAICDLLYCLVPLPFYSSLYIGGQWYFGEIWCKLTSILAHVFAYNSWMALALIALSRAFALPDTDIWKRVCDNGGSKKMILITWIFNLLILLPSFLEVISETTIIWLPKIVINLLYHYFLSLI